MPLRIEKLEDGGRILREALGIGRLDYDQRCAIRSADELDLENAKVEL
jgi:hypothetical protein